MCNTYIINKETVRKTWWSLKYYMSYWLIIHVASIQCSQSVSYIEVTPIYVIYEINDLEDMSVMVYLDTNIFLFLSPIFLDLIFLFFWFYFSFIDDEEACDCSHMTYHMMWGHRPRLGESRLEGWCQGVC